MGLILELITPVIFGSIEKGDDLMRCLFHPNQTKIKSEQASAGGRQ